MIKLFHFKWVKLENFSILFQNYDVSDVDSHPQMCIQVMLSVRFNKVVYWEHKVGKNCIQMFHLMLQI